MGSSVEPEPRNNARHKPCFVGGRWTQEEEIAVDQFRRLAEETTDAHL